MSKIRFKKGKRKKKKKNSIYPIARQSDLSILVLPRLGGRRRARLGQLADAAPVHALRQRRPSPAGVLPVASSDKAAGGGGTLISVY